MKTFKELKESFSEDKEELVEQASEGSVLKITPKTTWREAATTGELSFGIVGVTPRAKKNGPPQPTKNEYAMIGRSDKKVLKKFDNKAEFEKVLKAFKLKSSINLKLEL